MALDGAFLYAIKSELQPLIGGRVEKIHQPSREEVIISIRTRQGSKKVYISANAGSARVHITEKNVDNPYSTIVTKNENIETKKLIGTIENELKDDKRFFRTHRSCIVNLDNITSIELRENIIHFGKKETNLLSREKKTELKELLVNKVIVSKNKE